MPDPVCAEQCIKLLLARGTNLSVVDNNGDTLLHKVHFATPVTTVKLLAQAGAPTDQENKEEQTPLYSAINAGNFDVSEYLVVHAKVRVNLRMLIDAKIDHTVVRPIFGGSLLYTALGIRDDGVRARMVRYLVDDVKVDVNGPGGILKYPNINAAFKRFDSRDHVDTKILDFLVRRGADLEVSDDQGRQAAHLAAIGISKHGLQILLTGKKPADTNATDNFGRMPIHFANSGSFSDCFEYLLGGKLVKDVDVPDSDGWTPLMWAARSTNPVIQDMLTPKNAALERIRNGKVEVWNDADHDIQVGHFKGRFCSSCFANKTLQFIIWKVQIKILGCE
ncbi:ankyrin [Cryphonectria parasitica EP155]|uniref:Ankyrin n=1 Tax=Cryphonectria parasitica (strain ATCC 38755 / EP155) TaxID=660469 RepID=A0A9P5CME4_CRYP1|nr:ankyrin [Cryphonectria parasitica EP155]KAF3764284.1 ankyrin [Cryphonectria parasitica EP155]